MGNDRTPLGADGLPGDGVSHFLPDERDLQLNRESEEAVGRLVSRMEPLVRADNPHEKLFMAGFDGTGNDGDNPNLRPTNVHQIREQIKDAIKVGNKQIYVDYVAGPGTQEGELARSLDLAFGHTSPDRVEEMYRRFAGKTNEWHRADPDAQVRLGSFSFSRGGPQAMAFANLVDQRGIPDFDSAIKNPDGTITYARNLIEPGQIRQAMVSFDPVATGGPMTLDRTPPKSLAYHLQLTSIHERRAMFPSDRHIPMGESADGRALNVWRVGAHSNIGGGYELDAVARSNGNLAIDFCNGLCDRPFLQRMPVPNDPLQYVVHRSEESMLPYRMDQKVSRFTPEGVNTLLTPTGLDPRLGTRMALAGGGIGLGAVGLTAAAVEGAQTYNRHQLLEAQGNPLAAQSEANHYFARMVGGAVLGTTGAMLGSVAGPGGALAGGVAGSLQGERLGERSAAARDNNEIYQQTVRGVDWEFNGRAWTRAGEVDSTQDAKDNPRDTRVVASFEQARELNALASRKAVDLAMGAAPPPQDPFRLPANDTDPASLSEAPWLRDAQSGQWHRQIKTGVSGENNRGSYEQHTATPERGAQLDQQAAQVVWQNIANGPAAVAAQYQLGQRRHGLDDFGHAPEAVALALAPDRLQASDKQLYTRSADGAWINGQTRAEGNIALELETTRDMLQASLVEHRQQLASIPGYSARPPEQRQSEELTYRYRVGGTELTPEWQEAINLAMQRTRQAHGLNGPGSVELRPNAQGAIAADSPIVHLQRGADGVDRIVATTSTEGILQARKEVMARWQEQPTLPDSLEQRIDAQSPKQREAYTQALREANRQGVSAPQAEQIATLAAVQVQAPVREERQEPDVAPEMRREREPVIAAEQPTRIIEPTQVVEPQSRDQEKVDQARAEETQQPTVGVPGQSQMASPVPGAVAPELQEQLRPQAAHAQDAPQPTQEMSEGRPNPERQPEQPAPRIAAREPEQPAPAREPDRPAPTIQTNEPGLHLGDRGPDVEFLQHRLQRAGATGPEGQPVPLDGTYGVETEHAVRQVQQANNLPATGVADQALNEALARAPQLRQEPVVRTEPEQATPEQVVERPSAGQREVQTQAVAEAQRLGATPEQVQRIATQAVDDRQQTVEQRIEVPEARRAYAGPSLGGGGRSIERDEQQELTPRQAQSQSFPTDHHNYALFVAIQQQLPKDTPDEKTAEIMHQAKLGGIKRPDQLDEVVVENYRALVFGKTAGSYSQEVSLGAQAPALNETLQRSQDYDQQQALQMQQFQEQQARINQNQGGPTMTM